MSQAVETKKQNEKGMTFTKAFSSFSVDDLQKAKDFYAGTLGLKVKEQKEGLAIEFEGGGKIFIYPKQDHQPATFTVLNFPVDNISETVDRLSGLSVTFEKFDGDITTDEKGVFWDKSSGNGPNIAWFKDPAGNYLSVVED